jgi:hypothetical protein
MTMYKITQAMRTAISHMAACPRNALSKLCEAVGRPSARQVRIL